jgi:hypothetical protein
MPDVFWIGLGFPAFGLLCGLIGARRSASTSLSAAVLTGLFLGVMAGFPLLAIGLSTS